jgi:glycosyltransferase involved in cell wall biosynthesis
MRLVLIGDGESPHLLKWARALSAQPNVELWAASSRCFADGFHAVVPAERRLALDTHPDAAGGNMAVLRHLPQLARWLRRLDADWLHAHYLSSHGTLAWLAKRLFRLRGRLISSAWGSDILVGPVHSPALRWATARVLRASALCTSDSLHMAERMRMLGAREVMVFPFGLDALPPGGDAKSERLFFANRLLEPLYAPQQVLDVFGAAAQAWPDAQLVVANDGSLRGALEHAAAAQPWGDRVRFVGRLDAPAQDHWYRSARWHLSLPRSDSVSVSVLEAMAHGCVPVLSDLPANRELVRDGVNGVIAAADAARTARSILQLAAPVGEIAAANRAWIAEHAIFPQAVQRFVARLRELERAA